MEPISIGILVVLSIDVMIQLTKKIQKYYKRKKEENDRIRLIQQNMTALS